MTDEELFAAAESVHDGWFADDERIDWADFLDRLEAHSDVDLGDQLDSPLIRRVKRHIRAYRTLG